MRKSLLVIALALLSAQTALAGDSTKTAVGGGVGGALGNVVGGAIGGSTGAAIGAGARTTTTVIAERNTASTSIVDPGVRRTPKKKPRDCEAFSFLPFVSLSAAATPSVRRERSGRLAAPRSRPEPDYR